MYSLIVSFAASLVVTLVFGYLLGHPRIVVWYGLIPGLITLVAVFILLSRRFGKRLEVIMTKVQMDLQQRNPYKQDNTLVERAIRTLNQGYQYKRWLLYSGAQIDGQIGQLLFLDKQFEEAKPYLEKTLTRNWMAKAMLAVIYFKRKQYDQMKELFETLIKVAKKESLLWNLYAYCLWKIEDTNGAIEVLLKAEAVLPGDERITTNRLALQKKKKMKMRGWKEMWYQFHLDKPPQPQMQYDRRQMYRGH